MVLRKLGVLGSGLSVSAAAADITIVTEAIDLWIKQAHREGITGGRSLSGLFPSPSLQIPLSASAASVGDVLFPISMHVMVNSVDEPIDIIGPIEYADISENHFRASYQSFVDRECESGIHLLAHSYSRYYGKARL